MKQVFTLATRQLMAGLLFSLLLPGPAAHAQAPAWQMAVATDQAGSYFSQVGATATDASGNVYVAGRFAGTVQFGSSTLTSAGVVDVFVAKWSPATRSFVWAQRAGGAGFDHATALAVNGTSVYLTGSFTSPTAGFGSTTLTNSGYGGEVFVAKLTDAGSTASFVWAQRAGGTEIDEANALTISGQDVYIAGKFRSAAASFGSTTLANANNLDDAFVAKLTDAGSTASFVWAQQAGGSDFDRATAIAVTGANVYVAGCFSSAVASFGGISLTNAGIEDMFVAKLNDAGPTASFTWVQRAGGSSSDRALAMAVTGTSVYVAGAFSGAAATFGNTSLTNTGYFDAFVTKLTDAGSTGSFVWAQQAGGTGADSATAVIANGNSVYVAGAFSGAAASFGSTTLTKAGANNGLTDVFATKLIDDGPTARFAWAQRAGSVDGDYAAALAISGNDLYVAGAIGRLASFGTQTIASPTNTQVGFFASLTDTGVLASATANLLTTLTLAPNPAHATTTVQVPAVAGATQAVLTLSDALGRVVRTHATPLSAAGLRYELPLAGLPAGLYALQVQAGSATAVRRLVVE
jgi:hypothetical protein